MDTKHLESNDGTSLVNNREDNTTDRTSKEVPPAKTYSYKDVYNIVGGFGKYQLFLVLVITSASISTNAYITMMQFILLKPYQYWCKSTNNTNCEQSCPNDDWAYAHQGMPLETTGITDWGSYCVGKIVPASLESIYFVALGCGSYVMGLVSDYVGRRRSLIFSSFGAAFFGLMTVLSTNIVWFAIFHFMNGFFVFATYAVAYVLAMELVGDGYRIIPRSSQMIFQEIGTILLGIIALSNPTWKKLYMSIVGINTGLLVMLFFFCPESPRWSLANNRLDDAMQVLSRICRKNGKDERNLAWRLLEIKTNKQSVELSTFWRTKASTLKIIELMILWLICGFTYWGILINVNDYVPVKEKQIEGYTTEPQIVLIVFALMTMCFCDVLQIPVINKLGRRFIQTMAFLLGAASILIVSFAPGMMKTIFAALAFLFATYTFSLSYIRTTELFHTPVRNAAVGIGCFAARVGAMSFPLVKTLLNESQPITCVVYALLLFIGAMISWSLPETGGLQLPTNQHEADILCSDWTFVRCACIERLELNLPRADSSRQSLLKAAARRDNYDELPDTNAEAGEDQ